MLPLSEIEEFLRNGGHEKETRKFQGIAPIYPFTTENLAGYYPHLNLQGKTVLTVSGSGDHVLNAVYYGAAQIDAFDVNLLAKAYTELKMVALNYLTYDDFLVFFILNPDNRMVLSERLYNRFSHLLSSSTKCVFDLFYQAFEGRGCDLRSSHIFYNRPPVDHKAVVYNAYLQNRSQYLQTRNNLKVARYRFYQSNVTELVQSLDYSAKYDVILLSNIADYAHRMYPGEDHLSEFTRQIVHPLAKYLTDRGLICVACLFQVDYQPNREVKNDIYLAQKRRDILIGEGLKYEELQFPGAINGYADELVILRKMAQP